MAQNRHFVLLLPMFARRRSLHSRIQSIHRLHSSSNSTRLNFLRWPAAWG
jgi:hypothetical protein